jgi:hypothetical protein
MKKFYKVGFTMIMFTWFFISRLIFKNDTSFYYVLGVGVLYAISTHWIYSFIFNTNMHTHINKIGPNQSKTIRLALFIFAIGMGIYTTLIL